MLKGMKNMDGLKKNRRAEEPRYNTRYIDKIINSYGNP